MPSPSPPCATLKGISHTFPVKGKHTHDLNLHYSTYHSGPAFSITTPQPCTVHD